MEIDTTLVEESLVPVFQGLFPAFVADPAIDIRVVRGEQAKPRPNELTYVDIKIADFRQVGRERVAQPDAITNLSHVEGDYRLELRIRTVGIDAKRAISRIQFALNRPDIVQAFEVLTPTPLSLSDDLDIVHIPVLTETAWEQRSQMTVIFFFELQDDVDLGTIEQLDDLIGTLSGAKSPINITTGPITRP